MVTEAVRRWYGTWRAVCELLYAYLMDTIEERHGMTWAPPRRTDTLVEWIDRAREEADPWFALRVAIAVRPTSVKELIRAINVKRASSSFDAVLDAWQMYAAGCNAGDLE